MVPGRTYNHLQVEMTRQHSKGLVAEASTSWLVLQISGCAELLFENDGADNFKTHLRLSHRLGMPAHLATCTPKTIN